MTEPPKGLVGVTSKDDQVSPDDQVLAGPADVAGASPFDLSVLQIDLRVQFERPPDRHFWAIDLTRALVAALWRRACTAGRDAGSCIESASPRQCQRAADCVAHHLVPVNHRAGSEHLARLSLAAWPTGPASDGHGSDTGTPGRRDGRHQAVRLLLLGEQAAAQSAQVMALLSELLALGLREHDGPNRADCTLVRSRVQTLAERAGGLAQHQRWTMRTLSPWVVHHGSAAVDLAELIDSLWQPTGPLLRRIFKLVSGDLADHRARGHPAPDGAQVAWLAMSARQALHADLPPVRLRQVRLRQQAHQEPHGRFATQCVLGDLTLEVDDRQAALSLAPVLAVAEALGLGRATSKGHGAVQIRPH